MTYSKLDGNRKNVSKRKKMVIFIFCWDFKFWVVMDFFQVKVFSGRKYFDLNPNA